MRGVYLIHLSEPLGNVNNPHGAAQHYIGWASDIAARLRTHRSGRGAKMMAAVMERGIAWECVRRWKDATRTDERHLKNRHHARQLCPVCSGSGSGSGNGKVQR